MHIMCIHIHVHGRGWPSRISQLVSVSATTIIISLPHPSLDGMLAFIGYLPFSSNSSSFPPCFFFFHPLILLDEERHLAVIARSITLVWVLKQVEEKCANSNSAFSCVICWTLHICSQEKAVCSVITCWANHCTLMCGMVTHFSL